MRADLPEVLAVVAGAMREEVAPYEAAAGELEETRHAGAAAFRFVTLDGAPVLLLRTGVGLVSAAAGLATALGLCRPAAVLSTGSAGGLGADVAVGDVIVGESCAYTQADATAFGYVRGQIPGMPASFRAGAALLAAARAVAPPAGRLRVGQMVSGDAFVTSANVSEVREAFPEALSADMETTALAQVAHSHELPFLSVRGVSDLCAPPETGAAAEHAAQFSLGLEAAAQRSAVVVREALRALAG